MNDPMENADPHKFTTVKEGWEHYVWGMAPKDEEYHAHQRAFYAGALTALNIMNQALLNLGVEESFNVFNGLVNETQAFAEMQIKIHTPSENN